MNVMRRLGSYLAKTRPITPLGGRRHRVVPSRSSATPWLRDRPSVICPGCLSGKAVPPEHSSTDYSAASLFRRGTSIERIGNLLPGLTGFLVELLPLPVVDFAILLRLLLLLGEVLE